MSRPRILLADDDSEMRMVLVDMLAELYDVTVVCTGKELYTLMSERRDLYSAVICDVVMPHWRGDEAVKMAQTFGADLPVIFISGNIASEEIDKKGNWYFIPKPINSEQLLSTVAKSLS